MFQEQRWSSVEVTNTMEQNAPWEANSSSASQEIPHILRKLKVHYHIYESPPLLPVMSQINPIHAPSPISWKFIFLSPIYVWVIQVLFFPQVFSLEPCMHLSSTLCVPHALSISFILTLSPKYVVRSADHEPNMWWGVQIMNFLIIQPSPVPCCLSAQNLSSLQGLWTLLVIDELIIIFIFWRSPEKYWDINLKTVNQCVPPYPW